MASDNEGVEIEVGKVEILEFDWDCTALTELRADYLKSLANFNPKAEPNGKCEHCGGPLPGRIAG